MTTKPLNSDGQYYTDQDLAPLLGISIRRLCNKLTSGSLLPPRIQPPGCRTRLWPREAVHAWLEQFLTTGADGCYEQTPISRRGRPLRKAVPTRQI
jgi:hypothetical protein